MEKAFVKVLNVRGFPLPEEAGEVICFENDTVIPKILTDPMVTLSVY